MNIKEQKPMKITQRRLSYLLVAIVMLLSSCQKEQAEPNKDFVGKWMMEENNADGSKSRTEITLTNTTFVINELLVSSTGTSRILSSLIGELTSNRNIIDLTLSAYLERDQIGDLIQYTQSMPLFDMQATKLQTTQWKYLVKGDELYITIDEVTTVYKKIG